MSAMAGNPHYAEAEMLARISEETVQPAVADDANRAAIREALMAIAFEQRTANLVALNAHPGRSASREQELMHRLGEVAE